MAKPAKLSGFPEWLPQQRLVEQHVIDVFREVSELHGFSGIESRAVEPLDQLARKGEIDKEVYVLSRLHAQPGEDQKLGLHFDLTVPLARYVLEYAGHLNFPFRRYQIQKVWRGERPQEGRFREFYQADLDIVGQDTLPDFAEAEVALVMADILKRLPLPGFSIHINHRELSQAFFEGLGLNDVPATLQCLDKLQKIGPEKVKELLIEQVSASPEQADKCLQFAQIKTDDDGFVAQVQALGIESEALDAALAKLQAIFAVIRREAPGVAVVDLSIARGLDYYTGTVYETFIHGHENLGSICSGGRYDNLASDGKRKFPGVGLSIGLSRLVSKLLADDLVRPSRKVPTCVLVAVVDEAQRAESASLATQLRSKGIATEVSPSAAKFGKQIKYADKRGIPFVLFPGMDGESTQIKDIRSGEQVDFDAATWMPPAEDLRVRFFATK